MNNTDNFINCYKNTCLNIDVEKLKEIITNLTVTVSFNGFVPFTQDVINAKKLLEQIHEIADCTKDEFVQYINSGTYKENDILNSVFSNIQYQGMFTILGFDAIGSDPYIVLNKLTWLK